MTSFSGNAGGVIVDVITERLAQDERWGQQNHPDMAGSEASQESDREMFRQWAENYRQLNDGSLLVPDPEGRVLDWAGILLEEVYEALAESDPTRLREELIQVAAVAVAWVEAIDRRTSDS